MSSFVWTRTHTIAAAVAGVVVLVGGGIGLATTLGGADPAPTTGAVSSPTSSPAATPSGTESPTTEPAAPVDPLTGGRVSDNEVFAVKVENIAAARPQVGLAAADITFVEEVEGGQTRLIAVYHSMFPRAVEPVRSARTTDARLLPMFGRPGLVYSGANAKVQRRIDATSIVPLYNETRDPRRVAPHNVRVDLKQIAAREKVGRAKSIGWTFDDAEPEARVKTNSATARVGNDTFGFRYTKGRYTVRWRGQTYADGDSGKITKTDNVIVLRVRNRPDGNRDVAGAPSVYSDTTGHGRFTLYRDGVKLAGIWKRSSAKAPMRLSTSAGEPIPLKPGQTWVVLAG